MKGFLVFLREKAILGLAIGFLLGGAVSKLVASFISDIVNPILGLFLGKVSLQNAYIQVGTAKIMWGSFAANLIDFMVVAIIVYYGVQILQLTKKGFLDENKEEKKDKKDK